MPRVTVNSIAIKPVAYCNKIYPVEESRKQLPDLKTIGLKLNREQALHLSRLLILAAQDWTEIELTAYRKQTQNNGQYRITVTTGSDEHQNDFSN